MPSKVVDALLLPCVLLCNWLEYMGVGFDVATAIAAFSFIAGMVVVAVLVVWIVVGVTPAFWMVVAVLVAITVMGFFFHRIVEYLRAA